MGHDPSEALHGCLNETLLDLASYPIEPVERDTDRELQFWIVMVAISGIAGIVLAGYGLWTFVHWLAR